jgi:hypothetical protein
MEPFSFDTLACARAAYKRNPPASTHIDANPSSPPKLESQERATTPGRWIGPRRIYEPVKTALG